MSATLIQVAISITLLIIAFFPVLGRAFSLSRDGDDADIARAFLAWLVVAAVFTAIILNATVAQTIWKAMP